MRTDEQIAESIDTVAGILYGKLCKAAIKTAVIVFLTFTLSMVLLLTIIGQL